MINTDKNLTRNEHTAQVLNGKTSSRSICTFASSALLKMTHSLLNLALPKQYLVYQQPVEPVHAIPTMIKIYIVYIASLELDRVQVFCLTSQSIIFPGYFIILGFSPQH